jgi:hypothetical protein
VREQNRILQVGLDIAQAQLKPEIPTHCATDDGRRKTVTVIKRFRIVHGAILRDRPRNVTKPAEYAQCAKHQVAAEAVSATTGDKLGQKSRYAG